MGKQKTTEGDPNAWERLLDIGSGLAIYRVGIGRLREQTKNARIMSGFKFERLTETIKRDQRLESLPLCAVSKAPSGQEEMLIISGHHRVRAARAAGLLELNVIANEAPLTKDQIRAKQLAHNSINGTDDPGVLAELYREIDDIQARIDTALSEVELDLSGARVNPSQFQLDWDFEILQLVFLSHQSTRFEHIINVISDADRVDVADVSAFAEFAAVARKVGKGFDIRNLTAIVLKMVELCEKQLAIEVESPSEAPIASESAQVEAPRNGKKKRNQAQQGSD